MWLRVCSNDHAPLTVMPYIIFFFKIKNCLKVDLFISCDDRTGKMLHNICISAVAMSLRWATRGPWASCFLWLFSVTFFPCDFLSNHPMILFSLFYKIKVAYWFNFSFKSFVSKYYIFICIFVRKLFYMYFIGFSIFLFLFSFLPPDSNFLRNLPWT